MSDNNRNNNAVGGGVGFCGLLTLIFITLKLLNVIEWSWLWVLSPIWISAALTLVIVLIIIIATVIIRKCKWD